MPVNKLQRFDEITEMSHVLEYTDFQKNKSDKPKGTWNSNIFENAHPITLELGCGKANLTTSLAELHPEKNFVGIDIKGARLWKGAKRAAKMNLPNVRFLRMYIEHLDEYFAEDEVTEIWITFPDPYPKAGDRNKRLSAPRFLEMYQKILQPQASIHFKTDDIDLYNYTLKNVKSNRGNITKQTKNTDAEDTENIGIAIRTDFENKHRDNQKTIKYIRFNW